MSNEPPSDSVMLRQMRRTVYRMRYWCVLPAMVATVVAAAISVHDGYLAGLPGLMLSGGALGAAWTTAGWLRDTE